MKTIPVSTRSARSIFSPVIAVLTLGLGLAAFAAVPAAQADWHHGGGGGGYHGGHGFYGGRGYGGGGFGFGFGAPFYGGYAPYPYYADPYAYPDYSYPPPAVYAPPPAVYAPPPAAVSATPVSPAYQAPNGQTCRQYQRTVSISGAPQQVTGTACMDPDGTWRIVN